MRGGGVSNMKFRLTDMSYFSSRHGVPGAQRHFIVTEGWMGWMGWYGMGWDGMDGRETFFLSLYLVNYLQFFQICFVSF